MGPFEMVVAIILIITIGKIIQKKQRSQAWHCGRRRLYGYKNPPPVEQRGNAANAG